MQRVLALHVQDELTYNPFLRCEDPGIAEWCGMPGADPVLVLAELRRRKDNFGLSATVISGVLFLAAYCQPLVRRLGLR